MRKTSKRFLFFIQSSVPSNSGAGLSAFNYAKNLTKYGFGCTILCYDFSISENKIEIIEEIRIVRVPLGSSLISKLFCLILASRIIVSELYRTDYTCVYGIPTGREFFLLSALLLRKYVIFRSTLLYNDDYKSLKTKRRVTYFLLTRCVKIYWAINPYFLDLYEELGLDMDRAFLNSQGVDIDKFRPHTSIYEKNRVRKSLGLPSDKLILISVGYVIERKGYRAIFDMLEQIDEDFLYLVVGDYELEKSHYLYSQNDEMRTLFNYGKRRLGEKIKFLGPSNEVASLLRVSDIFVLNSSSEGVPNALLEAMASQLICVVSRLEGVDGYLTESDKNAIVIGADDGKGLDYIGSVISEIHQFDYLGINARTSICNKFSVRASVSNLIARI